MVIPKIARPASAKPAPLRLAPAPQPEKTAPAQEAANVSSTAPSLLLASPESALGRHWRMIAVAVVVVGVMGFSFLARDKSHTGRAAAQAEDSAMSGGWTRRGVAAPGRVVSVYDPSRPESDYRVEFSWLPDVTGVGWLFRIRDGSNYYAARIGLLEPKATSALAVEHFQVVNGAESAHMRKVVALAGSERVLRIRMDAMGPAFTLWAQGTPVDYWTDPRLASGAFGFYDERGLRPTLQTVRFTFFQQGGPRVAVTSLR